MSRYVIRLASKINKSLAAGYQDYLDSCEQDRREGHTPHYCEHGKSRWTDYDNICGPCEDGLTMGDPMQRMEYALDSAKRRYEKVGKITEANALMRDLVPNFVAPNEVYDEITRLLTP